MNNIDYKMKTELEEDINRIVVIIDSEIFEANNSQHPLQVSAFIELIIRLNDLLLKCNCHYRRIDFMDDIHVSDSIKDVTDTVRFIRNASCHIESDKNIVWNNNYLHFGMAYRKGILLKTPGFCQASEYDDDICFFQGPQRLYLNRHIKRAVKESSELLIKEFPSLRIPKEIQEY